MPATVFISYSHRDTRWKDRLCRQLAVLRHEGLLQVWHDGLIQAGADWWREIEAAMSEARVAILLVSADFLDSEFIRRQEAPMLMERRQREGLRVIPLIVSPCPWLKVKWLSALQARPVDGKTLADLGRVKAEAVLARLAEEVLELAGGTRAEAESVGSPKVPPPPFASPLEPQASGRDTPRGGSRGVPFQAPPLPAHYVSRPDLAEPLTLRLIEQGAAAPGILAVSALHGMGGIGKSTLAAALAHDPRVQERFPDGILWVALGQQPEILPLLARWVEALGDLDFRPTSVYAAFSHLRTLLYGKSALLIVDDAWQTEHVQPFLAGGSLCRVLLTSRRADIAEEAGAEVFTLEALAPEQALRLLAACLRRPLAAAEAPKAQALAEGLGFSPLALELAAARVRRGVSWERLQEALEQEVARLEELEGVRRQRGHHSRLLASLNLSLEALREEDEGAWEAFIRLAVLPDDALLAEPLAANLWGSSRPDARQVLELLANDALLLPGPTVSLEGLEYPGYRVHDLLHDLAIRRLTEPLPQGLGQTLAEAHSHLLEGYRRSCREGLWQHLPDDGYIHAHLSWHLERANRFADLHALLREETEGGQNAWYEARQHLGQTAGYLADVARAWDLADRELEENSAVALPSRQCFYAGIFASLVSIASRIAPALMNAFVRHGLWTPSQALAYAGQAEPSQRAAAFEAVMRNLPEAWLGDALREAGRRLDDSTEQLRVLLALLPRLSGDLARQALPLALQGGEEAAEILVLLLARLQEEAIVGSLERLGHSPPVQRAIARILLGASWPAATPADLVVGSEDLAGLRRVIEAHRVVLTLPPFEREVQKIYGGHRRYGPGIGFLDVPDLPEVLQAVTLHALSPRLPPQLIDSALDALAGVRKPFWRALGLLAVAAAQAAVSDVEEALVRALEVADSEGWGQEMIRRLFSRLPADPWPRAAGLAAGIEADHWGFAVLALAIPRLFAHMLVEQARQPFGIEARLDGPFTEPELVRRVLGRLPFVDLAEAIARFLRECSPLSDRLVEEIVLYLPAQAGGLLATAFSLNVRGSDERAHVLEELSHILETPDRERVLLVALMQRPRSESLAALVPSLPASCLPAARVLAEYLASRRKRTGVRINLLREPPHVQVLNLLELWDLSAVFEIDAEPVLTSVEVEASARREILELLQGPARAAALTAPVVHAPVPLRAEAPPRPLSGAAALDAALGLRDSLARATAVAGLLPDLEPASELAPRVFGALLEGSRGLPHAARAQAMLALAGWLRRPSWLEVLRRSLGEIGSVDDSARRSQLLTQAVAVLRTQAGRDGAPPLDQIVPPDLWSGFLDQVARVQPADQASLLAASAPWVSETSLDQVTTLLFALPEEAHSPALFDALAPRLSSDVLNKAIRADDDPEKRYWLSLVELGARWSGSSQESALRSALAMTTRIGDAAKAAAVLFGLGRRTSGAGREPALRRALQILRDLDDDSWRGALLARMVPDLPATLREELLQSGAEPGDNARPVARARLLTALAPFLSRRQAGRALALAEGLEEKERLALLNVLIPRLSSTAGRRLLQASRGLPETVRLPTLLLLARSQPARWTTALLREAKGMTGEARHRLLLALVERSAGRGALDVLLRDIASLPDPEPRLLLFMQLAARLPVKQTVCAVAAAVRLPTRWEVAAALASLAVTHSSLPAAVALKLLRWSKRLEPDLATWVFLAFRMRIPLPLRATFLEQTLAKEGASAPAASARLLAPAPALESRVSVDRPSRVLIESAHDALDRGEIDAALQLAGSGYPGHPGEAAELLAEAGRRLQRLRETELESGFRRLRDAWEHQGRDAVLALCEEMYRQDPRQQLAAWILRLTRGGGEITVEPWPLRGEAFAGQGLLALLDLGRKVLLDWSDGDWEHWLRGQAYVDSGDLRRGRVFAVRAETTFPREKPWPVRLYWQADYARLSPEMVQWMVSSGIVPSPPIAWWETPGGSWESSPWYFVNILLSPALPWIPDDWVLRLVPAVTALTDTELRHEALGRLAPRLAVLAPQLRQRCWQELLRQTATEPRREWLARLALLSPVVEAMAGQVGLAEVSRIIESVRRGWP